MKLNIQQNQLFQTKTTLKIDSESANVWLDSTGPNTPIVMEKRAEETGEQSLNYETNMVTDKVDKDMYFAGVSLSCS